MGKKHFWPKHKAKRNANLGTCWAGEQSHVASSSLGVKREVARDRPTCGGPLMLYLENDGEPSLLK